MWLAYHGDKLDSAYQEPWQRIEAFRELIRTTGSAIQGDYQPEEKTRILDIEALLGESLPAAEKLNKKLRKAVNMRF